MAETPPPALPPGEQGRNPLSPNHEVRDLITEITPGSGTWWIVDDHGFGHNVIVSNFTTEPLEEEPNQVGFVNDSTLDSDKPVVLYHLEHVPGAPTPAEELRLRVEEVYAQGLFDIGRIGFGWRLLAVMAMRARAERARKRGEDIATPEQTRHLIDLLTAVRDRGEYLHGG